MFSKEGAPIVEEVRVALYAIGVEAACIVQRTGEALLGKVLQSQV
jgi:hypothetical protein